MTNDTLAKLAACPFCGGQPKKKTDSLDERYSYANRVTYECTGCGCSRGAMGDASKPGYADNSTTEQRALDAWNRRALTAQALPAAEPEIWPIVNIDVDEAGAITNAKLYAPGLPAGNHDVYPVRVPYMDEHTEAWQACADEIRAHLPDWREGVNGIEWAVSAIKHLAANQFTGAFTGIAARKLAELADQGYRVNGYSLMHAETRARGFIDSGGFVGWWSNRDHEQTAQATAGWVSVPIEPTPAMVEAICTEHAAPGGWPADYGTAALELRRAKAKVGYAAALSALPQPPQPQSAQTTLTE